MGDYTIENIYQGGYSSLDPNKAYSSSFTGYRTSAGSLGLTTDPRTANIVKDASTKLSTGVKQIELALVSPELLDSIPKQQFEEMRQLGKLTGVDVSVHAPVIDSAGMSQQGFSEMNREAAERKITEALLRVRELKPDGNIPVVFHSAEGIPGTEWKTLGSKEKPTREAKRLIAVDKDSGKMVPLEYEERFYPGTDLSKPTKYTPEDNLKMINTTDWDNKITQLFFNKERADEILQQNSVQIQHLFKELNEKQERGENPMDGLTPTQKDVYMKFKDAKNYLDEINKNANAIFSKGYQYGDPGQKEKLREISETYKKEVESGGENPFSQSKAMHKLLLELQKPNLAPRMFVPIEEFAVENSSKTFGNAAFNAFSKSKMDASKTPIMVIENPPAGFGLSTGEDLKNLVIASREQFVKQAEANGMDKKEAEKTAEKLIGATWDVGHINMLRKSGFGEKEIIAETEKVAPYVKHVHLSDNFGFEHTELPMGMGNVPMKEIMAKLGEKGFEGKKIIEAGTWWQHFQTAPIRETLEGLGSPMYSSGGGPMWNQAMGLQQGYLSGYGMMLPSTNYQTFGAGFSQLPPELGGEMARGGGKFSQRGME